MDTERADLIADLRRPSIERDHFAALFRRGAALLAEDERALAARFGTSIPTIRRWLAGDAVPAVASLVLRWLSDDLEHQYIAAGRPHG